MLVVAALCVEGGCYPSRLAMPHMSKWPYSHEMPLLVSHACLCVPMSFLWERHCCILWSCLSQNLDYFFFSVMVFFSIEPCLLAGYLNGSLSDFFDSPPPPFPKDWDVWTVVILGLHMPFDRSCLWCVPMLAFCPLPAFLCDFC
jgi:hypothetical protein